MAYVRKLNKEHAEVPVGELQTHPNNPRRGDLEAIKRSIEVNGFYGAIVANKRTGYILAGNHRYLAARDLGYETLPVTWVDVGEREAKRILAADNKTSEMGGYDDAVLTDLLEDLRDSEMLEGSGYTDDNLNSLLDAMMKEQGSHYEEGAEGEGDDEADEEVDTSNAAIDAAHAIWGVVKGQLYKIGDQRLLCGDSTSAEDVGRLLGGETIDLLLTDPPYGVNYVESKSMRRTTVQKTIANDNLSIGDTEKLWDASLTLCCQNMKAGGNYYVCSPQGENLAYLMMSLKRSGFLLKHMLIWVKNHLVLGRCDYHYQHEPILYGWKEGAGHYYGGTRKETSLWECSKPEKSRLHPTMKPIALFERACINGSKRGERVHDPFCGSGTTLIAAHNTGRKGYGMEFDPEYCSVILQRLSELGLTPELISEG